MNEAVDPPRFAVELAGLAEGLARLADPKRHAYCPCWYEDAEGKILGFAYPGPCCKCLRSDDEHVIAWKQRRYYEEMAISEHEPGA